MRHFKFILTFFFVTFLFNACESNSKSMQAGGDKISSGSGADPYLEMTVKGSGKNFTMNMQEKIYLSHSGQARFEMNIIKDGKNTIAMKAISNAKAPNQSILLDDDAKTYSIVNLDSIKDDNNILDQHTKYTVNKIGSETIMGLKCVHARIFKKMNFTGIQSFMNEDDTIDIWMTKDIPMTLMMKNQFSKSMKIAYNKEVANQLSQMDCTGFPVQYQSKGKHANMNMALTKISRDNFEDSLFEIPAGYKKTSLF